MKKVQYKNCTVTYSSTTQNKNYNNNNNYNNIRSDIVRRQGQEAKVRAVHPVGRMGDRGHAAGARHEGDRRARGQGADDGTHVAAPVRTSIIPGRRSLRAQKHHVRDRHQAGVLTFSLDRGRHPLRRVPKQPHLQKVHRKWIRGQRRRHGVATRAGPIISRGCRPCRVPHPHFR